MSQEFSALAGGIVGGVIPLSRRMDRTSDRSRDAIATAEDANDGVRTLEAKLSHCGAADLERVSQDRCADLLNGVAYPAQSEPPTPSTFPTPPTPPERPILSREIAGVFSAYPGTSNEYNADGQMEQPQEPFNGQQFATGLALASVEVRAALAGLTRQSSINPTRATVEKIWTLFQGIYRASESESFDEQQAHEAIAAMLRGQSPSGIRKIAQFLSVTGVLATGASSETALLGLRIPAGTIQNAGDQVVIDANAFQVNQNAADTTWLRIRLDGLTGTVVADNGNRAIIAGVYLFERLTLTYLGSGQMRAAGIIGLPNSAVGSSIVFGFDPAIAHDLLWTVQHSTNNAANVTRYDDATIWVAR